MVLTIHGYKVMITRYARLARNQTTGQRYQVSEYDIEGPPFVPSCGGVRLGVLAWYLRMMRRDIMAAEFAGLAS